MAIVGLSALLCGMLMTRLKQPALVGYIIAGVLLGPSAFGVVQNRQQIVGLAELGILLLLFLIGIELSVRAFIVTWKIALTAVALQIAGSLGAIFLCATILGFTVAESILLGFVVALSSTAVAIKMLEETGQLRTRTGRIVVAILIAQDLAFLPMLLVVENIAGGGLGIWAICQIILSIGVLAVLIQTLNTRRVNLPFARIVMGNVDLSPLTGLVYCFGSGALFGLIGLTPAYGAFLAGLVIGRSNQREPMKLAVRPVESVLVMVFFLSVGLLIDFKFIVENVGTVLVLLLIVTLFKTALNIGILRALGETWQRATIQGLTLSQLGEFSFLLAAAGLSAGTMGSDESRLVIAVTVLSLSISPLWLASARRILRLASNKIDTLDELLNVTYGDEVRIVQHSSQRFLFLCKILMRMTSDRILKWVPFKWETVLTTPTFLYIKNAFHQLKIKIIKIQTWTPTRLEPKKTNFSDEENKNQFSPSSEKTDASQKGGDRGA
ncbi:MAG: cation:proton antiporter [Pseudomonadota bacterium]|nr:cation:proton antiporter [Pseudomonadota bacterium]